MKICSTVLLCGALMLLSCGGSDEDGGNTDTDSDTGTETIPGDSDSDTNSVDMDTATDWDSETYEYIFQDPDVGLENRVDNLLSLLTTDEKINLLDEREPAIERIGMKYVATYTEGLHGLGQCDGGKILSTQFPQAFGLGHTWDPEVMRQVGAVEGYEARVHTAGDNPLGMGLFIRAPMVDMGRDPRWGRTEESLGEDPYLVGELGKGFVSGLQGDDPDYLLAASTLKHFLANNNEEDRTRSSSDLSERDLREYYLVPFEKCIREADAQSFMTAYNAINGIPAAVTPLVKDIVIDEWGFDGMVCTDAYAFQLTVQDHDYFDSLPEAAAAIVKAGTGIFLAGNHYELSQGYEQGFMDEADMDAALRGMLRIRFRLGEFDPPERVPYSSIADTEEPWNGMEHMEIAKEVTRKSVVLLKNENNTLPLNLQTLSSIAVIGPRADEVIVDWYGGEAPYSVAALDGITNRFSGAAVQFAADNTDNAAADLAAGSDVAIVLVGNHPTCNGDWGVCESPYDGKETFDRRQYGLDPAQLTLIQEVYAANGNTVVVLVSSFPQEISWIAENIPAVVHIANSGQELGTAVAEVLAGDYNPAGRLSMTWYAGADQLPDIMDYTILGARTYLYFTDTPIYPFGYGLSYTSFAYDNLFAPATMGTDETIAVSVDVTNAGAVDGEEVVQLYVSFPESVVARPIRALKGFQRVAIAGGQTTTVAFELDAAALSYWNETQGAFVVEPGNVTIAVGASSADIRQTATVEVAP